MTPSAEVSLSRRAASTPARDFAFNLHTSPCLKVLAQMPDTNMMTPPSKHAGLGKAKHDESSAPQPRSRVAMVEAAWQEHATGRRGRKLKQYSAGVRSATARRCYHAETHCVFGFDADERAVAEPSPSRCGIMRRYPCSHAPLPMWSERGMRAPSGGARGAPCRQL